MKTAIVIISAFIALGLVLMTLGTAQNETNESFSWAFPAMKIGHMIDSSAKNTILSVDNETETLTFDARCIKGSMNGKEGNIEKFILSFKGKNGSIEKVAFSGIFKPGAKVSYYADEDATFKVAGINFKTGNHIFFTDDDEVHFWGFYDYGSGGDV